MSAKTSPVQAFYCCYLLRSTVRHASLYVGSTPNPVRRRRQHNGDAKGGAVRTSRSTLRPWEMTCLVTGFPSKVAALQFEWAWQNTHLTRHIAPASRITQAQTRERFSPKTGKLRKRNARPRMSLLDRLLNLHALLASSSFARWPLRLTFYAEDVYRVWQKSVEDKSDCNVEVTMDDSSKADNAAREGPKGIHAIDVGYGKQKVHLEKSQKLFEAGSTVLCAVCKSGLPENGAMALVCPHDGCTSAGHLECLAADFRGTEEDNLLPVEGSCPDCGRLIQWVDLVKEMTLRLRGEEEVRKLFKVRKQRAKKANQLLDEPESSASDLDDELDDAAPLPEDDWHSMSEFDEDADDTARKRSDPNPAQPKRFVLPTTYSEPVIEESDWGDTAQTDARPETATRRG